MAVSNISGVGSNNSATARGTKIVQPGSDMDKNSFLRILSAELTNQDPMNASDSTQYVAQMAQFTSLEQMSNLNTTMTMSSANALIGKAVALNAVDDNGIQYAGIVKSVSNNAGSVKLNVQLSDGTSKQFSYNDVTDVLNIPDNNMSALNENMLLLTASSLIGKSAEFSAKDGSGNNYNGTVKGVYIDSSNTVNFNIQVNGSGSTVNLPYSELISVKEA
ncbi:MAG: flagellar hook capping FlgD N-terminal domain-containing protein [Bacillota bacterium]|nr:flagellar hook capping FlgD N-terminal domain-containing protein [Bacillota bacterium]